MTVVDETRTDQAVLSVRKPTADVGTAFWLAMLRDRFNPLGWGVLFGSVGVGVGRSTWATSDRGCRDGDCAA